MNVTNPNSKSNNDFAAWCRKSDQRERCLNIARTDITAAIQAAQAAGFNDDETMAIVKEAFRTWHARGTAAESVC